MIRTGLLALLWCLAVPHAVAAQEFRIFQRIATTGEAPEGAVAITDLKPVNHAAVTNGIKALIDAWNSGQMQKNMTDSFYDRERLDNTITSNIPRDGKLKLLSVQGQQVLQQFRKGNQIISKISVTVYTEITYNDPLRGFRRFPGTTELILFVTEEVPG